VVTERIFGMETRFGTIGSICGLYPYAFVFLFSVPIDESQGPCNILHRSSALVSAAVGQAALVEHTISYFAPRLIVAFSDDLCELRSQSLHRHGYCSHGLYLKHINRRYSGDRVYLSFEA
jgi:hypothetical protein